MYMNEQEDLNHYDFTKDLQGEGKLFNPKIAKEQV